MIGSGPTPGAGWDEKHLQRLFLAALVALTALAYLPSLQAPWYYDDFNNIVENPLVADPVAALKNLFGNRGLAYLSFALNEQAGGLETFGYHAVNLIIHLATALLVYFLLRRIAPDRLWPAMLGALIFALHPVQTQAVTYIVQRMSSLAAFFYLATVLCYLRAGQLRAGDDAGGKTAQRFYYGLALVCAFLAALVKENVATLPAALVLCDLLLLHKRRYLRSGAFLRVLPFLGVPLFLLAQQLVLDGSTLAQTQFKYYYIAAGEGAPQLVFASPDEIRLQWLFTQFIVLWKYLRLVVLPVGQTLDYGYPLVASLLDVRSLIGLAAILGTLAGAWVLRRQQPLVAFGIFWFFLTISVESSIFPLDPVYEHRLYLPLFGLIVLLIAGLRRLRLPGPGLRTLVAVALVAVLTLLTVQRNLLWADPIAFWRDNAAKAPHNFRPRSHLSLMLKEAGRPAEALPLARQVVRELPSEKHHANLGRLYAQLGQLESARQSFAFLVSAKPGNADYRLSLSIILGRMGRYPEALREAREAVQRAPGNSRAVTNLGVAQARMGRLGDAARTLQRALAIDPGNAVARQALTQVLSQTKGR